MIKKSYFFTIKIGENLTKVVPHNLPISLTYFFKTLCKVLFLISCEERISTKRIEKKIEVISEIGSILGDFT